MVGDKINLRELFTKSESKLPSWVRQENIIYLIKNLKNGKAYVGQARWFPSRFIYEGLMSHFTAYVNCCIEGPKYYPILYKALRKYKSRNFEVSILEELDSSDELDEKEKYWIKELHTCIYDPECWGYNMTWGGDDITHLRKALLRLYPEHNGVSPNWYKSGHKANLIKYPDTNGMPTECLIKARERRLELYPDTNGVSPNSTKAWRLAGNARMKELYPETNGISTECLKASHSPEARKLANETNRRNHGGVLAWNQPDVLNKILDSQRRNHNGLLAFHTEKAFETQKKNHGGVLAFHTEDSKLKAKITKRIHFINKRISELISSGLQPTSENYWKSVSYSHLELIFNSLDQIYSHSECTELIKNIFDGMYWDETLGTVELLKSTVE